MAEWDLPARLVVMSVDSAATRMNPLVVGVLRSPFHWVLSFGLMLITVTGRRSGREYTIPVGYQKDGDLITVLASEAPTKQWWRNFEIPARAHLRVRGRDLAGTAVLVASGSDEFRAQSERTLRRLPFMAKAFGVDDYDRKRGLTEDQLAALGKNIAIVQIRINA